MTDRPSVFISYAHKDGMEFVRRLAFALEMYMDVYWDRRLQAGEYPTQLYSEIENRDYFLFVMTPYSLGSEWCKKEVSHAQEYKREIALARVYSGEGTSDLELVSKYTYGDFTEDFEVGFRRLTMMMLQQPYSSWELLSVAPAETLLNYLKYGAIPCLIAKNFIDWLIIEKLWGVVERYILKSKLAIIHYGKPFTPLGMFNLCPTLIAQFSQNRDFAGISLIDRIKPILEKFVNELMLLNDSDHINAGEKSSDLLNQIKKALLDETALNTDFRSMKTIQDFFDFEAMEKLKAFINEHSRRSRYLY